MASEAIGRPLIVLDALHADLENARIRMAIPRLCQLFFFIFGKFVDAFL